MWPVPEQNVHYWSYKSIDKKWESFWRDILMLANTFKILHNFNIFDKGGQKIAKTQDFEHQFFWRHSYDTKNNLERPRNFLKKKSKGSKRNDVEKGRFEDILWNIFRRKLSRSHGFSAFKDILKQEKPGSEACNYIIVKREFQRTLLLTFIE